MKLTVIVHPNAKRARIEEDLMGDVHVHVSEPPLEGKANRAVIKALATHYNVRENKVILLAGEKSKRKTFLVG